MLVCNRNKNSSSHFQCYVSVNACLAWKADRAQHEGTRSPIDRLRKVVLPFDSDVWVPLADDPHVLLKHPPVASGDTEHRQHRHHSARAAGRSAAETQPPSTQPLPVKTQRHCFMAQRNPIRTEIKTSRIPTGKPCVCWDGLLHIPAQTQSSGNTIGHQMTRFP